MKKINYREGECVVLPVRGGGFARGVVARLDGKGAVLGYFFGPRLMAEGDAQVSPDIVPENAVLIEMFGDLGLLNGEWRVIGSVTPWHREAWPMPVFAHLDDGSGSWWLRYYDEATLKFSHEKKVPCARANGLPRDGLSGYGAIEIYLRKILGGVLGT